MRVTGFYTENGAIKITVADAVIGLDGKSAYQSWREQPGNEGKTEAEFVAWLQQPAIDAAVIANAAAANANAKAVLANNAAITANASAANADAKAILANNAATLATNAATLATDAATLANGATTAANAATIAANNATIAANAAKISADAAALTANNAATNADAKAVIANNAATAANNATTAANAATLAANNAAAAATAAAAVANNAKGWSPVYAEEDDGSRKLFKLSAWIGGTGATPVTNIGDYVATTGFTAIKANAADFRGAQGLAGISRIPPWVAQIYAINTSVWYLGKYWTSNAATTAVEIPGTSSKWDEDLTAYLSNFQVEVAVNTTALESWKNKIILVTADATITIPTTLSSNWVCRIIVLSGYLNLAITAPKTWFYGTPVNAIQAGSNFMIAQRGATNSIVVSGNIVANTFIAEFDTTRTLVGGSNNLQVKLPFNAASFNPCVVDWGDGTTSSIATNIDAATLHTYTKKGVYKVSITGKSFVLHFNNDVERLKIANVISWGNNALFGTAFHGCTNLKLDTVQGVPLFTAATNIDACFMNCSSVKTINNINLWDTSLLTVVTRLFEGTALNQDLNLNLSSATSIGAMFRNNISLNSQLNFTTVSLTSLSSFLLGAIAFNQPITFDTTNVTNMNAMFSGATAFNQNLGLLNVSNVTVFTNFMLGKTPSTFSTANLDAIYNGWTNRVLQPSNVIDFGTAKYTAASTPGRSLLTRTNASVSVTAAVNNGAGLIRVIAAAHGRATGEKVFISGVTGTVEANGGWIVTVIDANTIDLQTSAFVNSYVSGGTVKTGYGWSVTDGGI